MMGQKMPAIPHTCDDRHPSCHCHNTLSEEDQQRREALLRFKADHSLVTEKMREQALTAYRAHKVAEEARNEAAKMKKIAEAKERADAEAGKVAQFQLNGWA
jgi:hypothetical protein